MSSTDTKVGHRFSTLTKIPALRWLEGKNYKRSETTNLMRLRIALISFPFSSEFPVERYFGSEVLSHDKGAADLDRLNDSAPLLFNHDPDRVIGVVERAYIDEKKRRGYTRAVQPQRIRSGSPERCERWHSSKCLFRLLH